MRFKKTMYSIKFKKLKNYFFKFFKNNAGRNNLGKITVFSKGFFFKKQKSNFFFKNTWDIKESSITAIIKNKKKLQTLTKHNCGSFFLKPYINSTFIGQNLFSTNLPIKFWKYNTAGNFVLLKFLLKHTICSNIFIKNSNKYATSNGTFCQVLEHFYDFNLVQLSLPSKHVKIFSGWCFVYLGRNAQIDYKYSVYAKAGVRIFLGKKPKVRGVARNPVDHPHGGRTKTNQPEVSIWGWVAKRNK